MGHLLEYSGIVTKTRAMESRLLSPGQFQELASLHTIPEAVEYLKKNTAYAASPWKYRKAADSVTLPGLYQALPFLRTKAAEVHGTAAQILRD